MESPLPDAFSDHIFATKHTVPLYLRIYPAPHDSPRPSTAGGQRPFFFWIHGGAYCSGQHYQLRSWILPLLHARGYHVVGNAYRFMPNVEMGDMVEDCHDALRWCIDNLPEVLKERQGCDVSNYILGGDSAGGGLATLLTHRISAPIPEPKVLINLYGVTDLVRQQAMYDGRLAPIETWRGDVTLDEMMRFYNDRDPSHAVTDTTNRFNLSFIGVSPGPGRTPEEQDKVAQLLKQLWKVSDEEWRDDERVRRQWDVKRYVEHTNCMVSLALQVHDEMSLDEKEKKLRQYSTVHLLDATHSNSHPPTVIIHGTADKEVPIQESKDMAAKLKEKGVDVLELYVEGVDHGFDSVFESPKTSGWDKVIEPIGRFIDQYVGEGSSQSPI